MERIGKAFLQSRFVRTIQSWRLPRGAPQFDLDVRKAASLLNFHRNVRGNTKLKEAIVELSKLSDEEQSKTLSQLFFNIYKDNDLKYSDSSALPQISSPGVEIVSMRTIDQLHFCREQIEKQLFEMHRALINSPELLQDCQLVRNARALFESIEDKQLRAMSVVQEKQVREAKAVHPQGFTLRVKKSSIDHPEAGLGVFIEGQAMTGTVLTMYSGIVRFAEELDKSINPRVKEYMFARADNTVMDGHAWTREAFFWRLKRMARLVYLKQSELGIKSTSRERLRKLFEHTQSNPETSDANIDDNDPFFLPPCFQPSGGDAVGWNVPFDDLSEIAVEASTLFPSDQPIAEIVSEMLAKTNDPILVDIEKEGLKFRNPYTLGHFINHPTPPFSPNVMCFPFDFPYSAQNFQSYIPYRYARPITRRENALLGMGTCLMRGLVVIATKPLNNEELFLNYRYNPTQPTPSWYVPVDIDENYRRWVPNKNKK